MILDLNERLSSAQALTATAVSTNTRDNDNVTPKRDIGAGEPLELVVAVGVAADFTTGDETYELQFIQSANADLSSQDVLASRTIAAGLLTAGSLHRLPVPAGAITKRYVGARYVLAGTSPSVTVTTYLQPSSMAAAAKPVSYAKGYTIS